MRQAGIRKRGVAETESHQLLVFGQSPEHSGTNLAGIVEMFVGQRDAVPFRQRHANRLKAGQFSPTCLLSLEFHLDEWAEIEFLA